jgi:hypothetical protein
MLAKLLDGFRRPLDARGERLPLKDLAALNLTG